MLFKETRTVFTNGLPSGWHSCIYNVLWQQQQWQHNLRVRLYERARCCELCESSGFAPFRRRYSHTVEYRNTYTYIHIRHTVYCMHTYEAREALCFPPLKLLSVKWTNSLFPLIASCLCRMTRAGWATHPHDERVFLEVACAVALERRRWIMFMFVGLWMQFMRFLESCGCLVGSSHTNIQID